MRDFLRRFLHRNIARQRRLALACYYIIYVDNWEGRLESLSNYLEHSYLRLRQNLKEA